MISCDTIADLDPSDAATITKIRLGAERDGRGVITVPFPHVCGSDEDILDVANYRAMLDAIEGAYGSEPHGYRQAYLSFVATDANVREYAECVGYLLREYPILDDSLFSELEYEDAQEQWEQWGRSEALECATESLGDTYGYDDADGVEDDLDALRATPEGAAIADDIIGAAVEGWTADGYGSECVSTSEGGARAALQIQRWHALRAWNVRTSNGNQMELLG